ncbi:MAG: RHS repeat-associated core domain-containing protein [Taibaiella sp.]
MQLKYLFSSAAVLIAATATFAQNTPVLTQTAPAGTVSNMSTLPEIAVSPSGNSITTYVPLLPVTNGSTINAGTAATTVKQQKVYTDGFNEPIQSITRNVAIVDGQAKHLVQINYNGTQKDQYSFLPFSTNDANVQSQALQKQRDYYNALYPGEGYTSFTKSVNNPGTDRSVTSYSPGKSQVGQAHGTVLKAIPNAANEVRIWDLNAQGVPVSTSFYAANELFGKETAFPSADGTINTSSPRTRTYTDRDGNIILKMVAETNAASWQYTYYVYDAKGNPVNTITPKAYDYFVSNGSLNSTVVNNLCFQNVYDSKGRMAGTRKPGETGFTWAVYDRKNRIVMRQTPGEAVNNNEWEVIFYDIKNRVKATSVYLGGSTQGQAAWQAFVDNGTGGGANDLLYFLCTDAGEKAYPDAANPFNTISSISNNTMMSYTWYDSYDVAGFASFYDQCVNQLQFTELVGTAGAETPVLSKRVNGMVTASMARVLRSPQALPQNVGDWRISLKYYDDKGRTINTVSFADDETSGAGRFNYDYTGTQYDFAGRPLITKHVMVKHNAASGQPGTIHWELTRNYYDELSGSLTKTARNVDYHGWKIISTYAYDDMGRVKRKVLGNSGEVRDYSYNIRGQLTGINGKFAETGNKEGVTRTFGESLKYDYGFTKPRYDGKIAGMIWRGGAGLDMFAYGYDYTQNQSLKSADFRLYTGGAWSNQDMDYTVSNLQYDKNGNITSMKQRGEQPGVGPVDMDNLAYSYMATSNQLSTVADNGVAYYGAGDFKNGTNSGADYSYDANGNLQKDGNRDISIITYTRFNKPLVITKTNGSTIEYSYDAAGNKLEEIVKNPATNLFKRTDYIGNGVYENNSNNNSNADHLQYLLTAEGRTVFDNQSADPVREEFFVKDHLGNVRSVINVITYAIRRYLATYELASAHLENLVFDNIDEVRDDKPGGGGDNTMAAKLDGDNPDTRIGTSMLVHVMAGDRIAMNVDNYYENYNAENDQPVNAEDMMSSVISTLTAGAGGLEGSESHNVQLVGEVFTPENYNVLNSVINSQTDPSRPKAYLNYVLFDERMKAVPGMSGAFQANGAGGWSQIGTTTAIEIPANGYLAVYLSNSSQSVTCNVCHSVWFDKMKVEISKGNLLEETHYYPFGLPIQGLSSQTADNFKENRRKYQGNELIKDLDLNLMDFNFRQYDQQIGRFLGIDPLAAYNGQDMFSPYAAMGNTPEGNVDPNGLTPQSGDVLFPASPDGMSGTGGGYAGWGRTGGWMTNDQGYGDVMQLGGGGGGSRFDTWLGLNAFIGQVALKREQAKTMEKMVGIAAANAGQTVNFDGDDQVTGPNVLQQVNITAQKGTSKSGPGFFGKLWGGIKNAWSRFARAGDKLVESNGSDKTYSKDGGGIEFKGSDGQNQEGRKVGNPDEKSVNVDAMMFMFGHGGSGGFGNWSDNFEKFDNLMKSLQGIYDATSQMNDVMKENGVVDPGWKTDKNGIRSIDLMNADTNRVNLLIKQYTDSIHKGLIPIK